MSRVSDSYESVVRGVSEQVPQDRHSGQVYAQDNFIPDPVRGNARRHGSECLDEVQHDTYDATRWVNALADTAGHKVFPFQCMGKEYDLIYRATNAAAAGLDGYFMWCFNRTDSKFIPVVASADALITALRSGGVSALVNLGRFVMVAGNTNVPTFSGVDAWAATNQYLAAWVRGGAYSRTYTIQMTKASGAMITATYTAPSSSYPGVLDTSDIPYTATDYTKQVNDRVNAYNGAVTAWIGTAAAGIVPKNIAANLVTAINTAAAGTGLVCSNVDSTIVMNTSAMTDKIVEIVCYDGGDNSLFRAVGNVVSAADQVSTVHMVGKVIKVRPKKSDDSDSYYLKAVAKVTGQMGWVEVTWQETAGYITTPSNLFAYSTVHNGQFLISGTPAGLDTLSGGVLNTPTPVASACGDRSSTPIPEFIANRIDYLGMFQDRLAIGYGATMFFSRTGDYLNFFRQSVLAVDDNDPVEMFALGAEDDTIRYTTTYDRNLLIFGKKHQYVVSGRAPMTPKNASIVVQSSHEDAVDAPPRNSGNFVFYAKYRNGKASMHQVQIGQLVDTPESYEVSKQLDTYLVGKPSQLVAVTSPNVVFFRTEANRQAIYTYSYLDTAAGTERLFDAWARWTWHEQVGSIVGLSQHDGDIIAYMLRRDSVTGKLFVGAELFVLDTELSDRPYLDSLRRCSTDVFPRTTGTFDPAGLQAAVDNSHEYYLFGTEDGTPAGVTEFATENGVPTAALWRGWNFDTYVTPTNEYVKDRNGKAIVNGRLTYTSILVSIANSSAMKVTVETKNGTNVPTDFTGRLVGRATNMVGRVPILSTAVSAVIGREVRDFTYTLSAKSWLPLTITAIEWKGQYFNNTRRM